MRILALLGLFLQVLSIPLQQNSLISLRTTILQPSAGGNVVLYKQLVLEEWSSTYQFIQNWSVPCTLPDLSTESTTEGLLRSRYPYGDGVWFLCRSVPVGANLSYIPAPVDIMYLQENGELIQWSSDTTTYAFGTSANLVLPYYNAVQDLNVFYLLGGGRPPGPGTQVRPTTPRLRIDTGPQTPPDVTGALANIATNVNPTGMSIMENSLYIPAQIPNGTTPGPLIFVVFLCVPEGTLPIQTRSIVSYALYDEPLMLSVWTFPFIDTLWFTGFNRLPYLARVNYSNTDPAQQVFIFPQPPGSASGTLGGPQWRVNTARFEGAYQTTGETVYISNTTNIFRNTVLGLAQGLPYQPTLRAPENWKYMDIHARQLLIPTPSASATATATASSSASATSSGLATFTATPSPSSSASASASASATGRPTLSALISMSSSPSASSSASVSSSRNPNGSPSQTSSPTPSTTPSNGTVPIDPGNAATSETTLSPGAQAGIGVGTVAAACVAGLLLLKYSPILKNLYTRQFGSSIKVPKKKGLSFRSPVSADAPITISHNPNVLVQHRLEQLKDLQKQLSTREVSQSSTLQPHSDRVKKEFGPTVTGQSV
jgi:hypothetical protein